MYKLTQAQDCQEINLDTLHPRDFINRIIIAEKGEVQSILVLLSDETYIWNNFYVKNIRRTVYANPFDAIESRIAKGMTVYMLCNKRELKSIIKHK